MDKPAFTFQVYDFNLVAGGSQAILASGAYLRILSSTGAIDVSVEGKGTMPNLLAGQGLKDLPFNRVVVRDKSGAPNTGTILVASSEFVDNRLFGTFDLSPSTLAALESVDLNPATLATMRTPLGATGSYANAGAIAINTATNLFTPGSNVNGAILLSASVVGNEGSNGAVAFLAKSSAPASITDGEVLHAVNIFAGNLANPVLPREMFIPAGLGLYMFNTLGLSAAAQNLRSARWRLL